MQHCGAHPEQHAVVAERLCSKLLSLEAAYPQSEVDSLFDDLPRGGAHARTSRQERVLRTAGAGAAVVKGSGASASGSAQGARSSMPPPPPPLPPAAEIPSSSSEEEEAEEEEAKIDDMH